METKHWTYLYDGENPSHAIGNNISIYFFSLTNKHLQHTNIDVVNQIFFLVIIISV